MPYHSVRTHSDHREEGCLYRHQHYIPYLYDGHFERLFSEYPGLFSQARYHQLRQVSSRYRFSFSGYICQIYHLHMLRVPTQYQYMNTC